MLLSAFVSVSLSLGAVGCATPSHKLPAMPRVQSTLPIDPSVGEVREPDEEQNIRAIEQAVFDRLVNAHASPPIPRDAHAKAHGCVQAFFDVSTDLPTGFATDLLQAGKRFPAWVRFSNADAAVQADQKKDARGMAIKVMGVPGEKLIGDEKTLKTHDLMLINSSTFFVRNLGEYVGVLKALKKGSVAGAAWFAVHPHAFKALNRGFNTPISNPLQQKYDSTTPYRLNALVVKYVAKPCTTVVPVMPMPEGDSEELRHAMKRTLDATAGCFDFFVQPRTNGNTQPVEDSTVEWTEAQAPLVKVATLHIPKQDFSNAKTDAFCEALSFTPWHALPAHRPLGSINRARLRVYELISRYRNKENGVAHQEPTGHICQGVLGASCE